ncbi:MAG TPA: GNAT family N-acetyltransferase [Candidatus Bathyarchaeia archaeon]|nr:GNAT family N-acetyltransferase [Candidatus Bathyarchaeia archaeon]
MQSGTAIKEIKDFDSSEFKQSREIYKSSFPLNETRSSEKVVELLENDKDYHLFSYLYDNSVVGISLMYIFRSLSVGLLDYMAVIPNHQGKGIGMELFKFSLEQFSSVTCNGIGLLMEIQREDVPDPLESNLRKRRVRFYAKNGARVLDGVNYLLPPIHAGMMAEEMYLMIRPLRHIHFLSTDDIMGHHL